MMAEEQKFVPYVSAETNMKEFTLKALIIGLILAVVLGAANAYLGLKAGMTIAATYPAAVIGMALLKIFKGSILEENFTRTVGSIGESVAAGAIFTIPAFFIAGIWIDFGGDVSHYLISSVIMLTGGILGIMFVALLRRVMVSDKELPFPESVAAAEIHKTGRASAGRSVYLFSAMIIGGVIKVLGDFKFFATSIKGFIQVDVMNKIIPGSAFTGKGGLFWGTPGLSPAYLGVGYIIGPRLAAMNFSGGVIAWGLLSPIILYFIYPYIDFDAWIALLVNERDITPAVAAETVRDPMFLISEVWAGIVRYIAIGGMLVGTAFTLWNMRKSLITGIARSIGDLKKAATAKEADLRTESDIKFNWTLIGILGTAALTFVITAFIFGAPVHVAITATIVMIIAGFFFAAVSGYLVGIIGSSNNPISGLTITTVVITALLMFLMKPKSIDTAMNAVSANMNYIAAVLGVAAIVCVSAAVAGEMLQDLKAGHILGGTPWKMEVGDILGVLVSAAVMFFPLLVLHQSDVNAGGVGFGGAELPAPQASLMALLSKGIILGEMPWIFIIVGMLMGVAFILMQIKSPMLVSIGMYLPLTTTFAIFIGGIFKWMMEAVRKTRNLNAEGKEKTENIGILLASGMIAGEALVGLILAGFAFFIEKDSWWSFPWGNASDFVQFIPSLIIFAVLAIILVSVPVNAAKKAN